MINFCYTRKILQLGFFVVCALQAGAQIESGLWFVESSIGDFRREHAKYDEGAAAIDDKYSNVAIYPSIGYMAGEHIAFGVRLKSGFEKGEMEALEQHMNYNYQITRNSLSIEPFMRLYFPTAHYRTRPYIQLGAGKGYMSTREEYSRVQAGALTESQEYSRHDEYLQVDAELGLNYLLSPNIAISSGVGYYLMYGKFDYNVQKAGVLTPQSGTTKNGNSSKNAMLWRLGFALFL